MERRQTGITRRQALRAGGGIALTGAAAMLGPGSQLAALAQAAGALRRPGTLPDPGRPAGEPTAALPFDHIVVVMMENHSFDNYLGMLPRRGQPLADGFTFDRAGRPLNSNPVKGGFITVKRAASLCTPDGSGSQSWNDTHHQIDAGRMDGFARTGESSMTYWDADQLPFYYSLANTFCLANRWFCSAPCQTYPNRRFLLAGTAFGLISTDTSSITQNPPNGTIFDRLNAHGISWTDYFADVPATGVIESVPQNNPTHLAPIQQFYADCAAGALPAVSFVDSDIGAAPAATGEAPAPFSSSSDPVSEQNQDEENGDISLGENFVAGVTKAVLGSPLWPRILLVWLYDEHGGWYDHVPPPAAIPPDSIRPRLSPGDVPGGYDILGPRVPAVVVSGYARPHSVTDVVHDHTSILATIEAKWNLPAMTYRDANAATLADFLAPRPTFPEPPKLAAPSNLTASEQGCDPAQPTYAVSPTDPGKGRAVSPRVRLLRVIVARNRRNISVRLATDEGELRGLAVQLRDARGHTLFHHRLARLSPRPVSLHLSAAPFSQLPAGHYALIVLHDRRTLLRRRVTIP
jgi:phospholipase C